MAVWLFLAEKAGQITYAELLKLNSSIPARAERFCPNAWSIFCQAKSLIVLLVVIVVVVVSVFAWQSSVIQFSGVGDNNNSENEGASVKQGHFSVKWLGFRPDYSNETPDYYICINNLIDDVLTMHVALRIQNFENSSYYFMIEPYGSLPANWSAVPYYLGLIEVDETRDFYYNLSRVKPESIPEGSITETVDLVVKAY